MAKTQDQPLFRYFSFSNNIRIRKTQDVSGIRTRIPRNRRRPWWPIDPSPFGHINGSIRNLFCFIFACYMGTVNIKQMLDKIEDDWDSNPGPLVPKMHQQHVYKILAKFRHFGKFFWPIFNGLFNLPTVANLYAIGQIFFAVNCLMLNQNLSIWSHWQHTEARRHHLGCFALNQKEFNALRIRERNFSW